MRLYEPPSDVVARIEDLAEAGEEILMLEPREQFDECLLGVGRRFHDTFAVYSMKCVLDELAKDAPDDDPDYPPDLSAREYFEFNTVGAWVGSGTWAFIDDTDD